MQGRDKRLFRHTRGFVPKPPPEFSSVELTVGDVVISAPAAHPSSLPEQVTLRPGEQLVIVFKGKSTRTLTVMGVPELEPAPELEPVPPAVGETIPTGGNV